MNRRSFFRFLGAGAATLALSEAIPFGRVWSFPSKIVVPEPGVITLDQQFGIDFAWERYEKCVLMERSEDDIRRLYLEPAARQMARQIDALYSNHPASRAQTSVMRRILGLVPVPA